MKIGISIVHYGERQILDNLLATLPNDTDTSRGVFFSLIHDCNIENIGFTAGNNTLIKTHLSQEYDWIWLLNNDTIIPKETLININEKLNLNPFNKSLDNIGIIGFKILSMDNPDLIHHAGTLQAYPNGIHKSGSVRLRQFEKRTFEKWVTFASVLIRREVFETCGLLDERFFNYCSDSDFCYTARSRGWKIIYEPTFVIQHKIGQSGNPSPEQKKIMAQDHINFSNKWINGKSFFDLDKELL